MAISGGAPATSAGAPAVGYKRYIPYVKRVWTAEPSLDATCSHRGARATPGSPRVPPAGTGRSRRTDGHDRIGPLQPMAGEGFVAARGRARAGDPRRRRAAVAMAP